jgi:hypothetical protein
MKAKTLVVATPHLRYDKSFAACFGNPADNAGMKRPCGALNFSGELMKHRNTRFSSFRVSPALIPLGLDTCLMVPTLLLSAL